jgi:hypothetical protein
MRLALAVAALAALPALAQNPPDFSGSFMLNPKLSDDAVAKVEAATGSAQLKGGGQGEVQRLVPRSTDASEVERVRLREFLLDRANSLQDLKIEQTAKEIKIVHGEDDVRIFYFGRDHVRNDRRGRKLQCKSRFEAGRLIVEELGEDKTRIIDVLTLVPSRRQIVYGILFENQNLKEPLQLNLVYDEVK